MRCGTTLADRFVEVVGRRRCQAVEHDWPVRTALLQQMQAKSFGERRADERRSTTPVPVGEFVRRQIRATEFDTFVGHGAAADTAGVIFTAAEPRRARTGNGALERHR